MDEVTHAPTPQDGGPTVSVIVPAYKAAWSIERTLRSACAQTLRDIEILVVDDGSPDATAEVVERLAAEDPRIRLIRKPNGGVASARNRGLAEARGRYVAPLDSDDLWAAANLERQVAALEARPEAVFAFAYSGGVDMADRITFDGRVTPEPRIDFEGLLLRNAVTNGSASVFRRALLEAVGGWDERHRAEGAQGAEDWKLSLTLAARGPVALVAEPLVYYRESEGSMSRSLAPMGRGALRVIEEMRRDGPPLPERVYRDARTLVLSWLLPRAVQAGDWRSAGRFIALGYLANPRWLAIPEARWRLKESLAVWREGRRASRERRRAAASARPFEGPARADRRA